MASKIKKGLETANMTYAGALARAQVSVDRILWGTKAITKTSKPDDRSQPVAQKTTTASQRATSRIATTAKQRAKKTLDKGLIPVLDDLLALDLCNLITYSYSQVGRPATQRSESPTRIERNLYFVQDQALAIQKAIDAFTTYPDRLIGRFSDGGVFDQISQDQARAQTNGSTLSSTSETQNPIQSSQNIAGNQTIKFNLVNLVAYIQTVLSDIASIRNTRGASVLEPSDKELVTAVPKLQLVLILLSDLVESISINVDYRSISNGDLQKARRTLNKIRAACVTIQNLSISDPTTLLNLVPPTAIQAQLRNLDQSIDLTDLIPLTKKISQAVKSFTRSAQIAQGVLEKAQFIIKIAITILRILKAIVIYVNALMAALPSILTTAGIPVVASTKVTKLERIIEDLVTILSQVNELLSTTIYYIRYLLTNARGLSVRLDALIAILSSCDATKDSSIVEDLQQSSTELKNLETTLQSILDRFDGKTDPKKSSFGSYTIEVIDEQVVDEGITNRRRRGIALDNRGIFVLQSDLTFATDLAIIIQEVKVKLVAAGLVQPGLASIDPNITVITESLSFLEENDLLAEDLNVNLDDATLQGQSDQELTLFIDGLRGSRRLRQRTKARTDAIKANFGTNSNKENNIANKSFTQESSPPAGSLSKYEVQVYQNAIISRRYSTSAASADDAIKQAKNELDPDGKHPKWKYVARKV